jgi:ABC-type multidrug transport system ATPase subunit
LNTPSAASVRNDNGYVFRNVNALLLPGEATLLLGPSSSGKTTFLRTICGKINGEISPREDTVEGSVLIGSVDPSELDENLSRATAFVDQTDVTLTPVLTVEETVRFASACAQGTSDSIDQTIDTVIQLAGLDHVKSTIIGDAELRGISGGQKRRVKLLEMAVGIDLHLMALDEITNGLDAASALTICKVARAAVEAQGFSSTTALLQPSSEVFRTFHRLILLTSEGEVAYSGPTEAAVTHFQSLGLSKPFEMNEADFLLQCASSPSQFGVSDNGEVPGPSLSSTNLATLFIDSKAGSDLMAEIERVEMHEANTRKHQVEIGDSKQEAKIPDFALPTHKQILLLVGRGAKLVARNPASLQRVISSIIFGAFIGTLFLNTGSDEQGTTIRAGYGAYVGLMSSQKKFESISSHSFLR